MQALYCVKIITMQLSYISKIRSIFDTLKFYVCDFLPRRRTINKFLNEFFYKKNEPLVVLGGPFKGLKYKNSESYGSALTPKFLGTYENELVELVEIINKTDYQVLIDVGCAEGYYAVGFAKFGKFKKVYAYDIAEEARLLCSIMSKENNVEDKIEVKGLFNKDEFVKLKEKYKNSKFLLILDVEGSEVSILNDLHDVLDKNVDILIEVHDFIDTSITKKIEKMFENIPHKKIFSIDDFQKAVEYDLKILKEYSFLEKYYLFLEGRPQQMKWMFYKGSDFF